MRKLIVTLVILLFTGNLIAADYNLNERLFPPDEISLGLLKSGLTPTGQPQFSAKTGDSDRLNPGKALVLSAIIPGAGQRYAGQTWKGVLFLAVEIGAWYGVVHYYNEGQKKDDEFKAFADEHFSEDVYRWQEFNVARDPRFGSLQGYPGDADHDFNSWTALEWDEKIKYLPSGGFTHELPTEEDRRNPTDFQQFYEMIGKYIHQFGFGWDDVYQEFAGSPGQYWFRGDLEDTGHYDNDLGIAAQSADYMDMRHESNKFLDYSAYAIQVVMLNHVAAALEASFSVRAMNRKAKAEVGFRQINYNDRPVAVGGLNFTW